MMDFNAKKTGMLYPAMGCLTSYVPNRYLLVNVVARRARQIAEEAEETGTHLDEKPWPSTRWPRVASTPPRWTSPLRRRTCPRRPGTAASSTDETGP